MPDTISPRPNKSREQGAGDFHVRPQHVAHYVDDGEARPMNNAVAASERREPRDSPQTPWPLVQPEA